MNAILWWRFCYHQAIFVLLLPQMFAIPNQPEYNIPLIVVLGVNAACCVLAMEGR